MAENIGKVYIVGAGCGDADLITVRGRNYISKCDVIVYDDLISPNLLNLVKPGAEIIYMGKRSGKHSASQDEINQCLIDLALQGKSVCRLKGGDPFVFGRGGEEILALKQHGIHFEEVPGISSAIAIPACVGIPVTHRKMSRSFHVITAHSADTEDGLPKDMDKYAGLSGTLIFLMGLSKLDQICTRLICAGKDKRTPAAVISGGNSTNPAFVKSTLENLPQAVKNSDIHTPAIIMVGNVVELDLFDPSAQPLSGKRIGITGTDRMAAQLSESLSALGAQTLIMERSEIVELHPRICADDFDESTWIVFTSGNGIRQFFRVLAENSVDVRSLAKCRFAVIGGATKKELLKYGIHSDYCPEKFTGSDLAEGLKVRTKKGDKIFLFRSAKGDKRLLETLSAHTQTEDIFTYDVQADTRISAASSVWTNRLDFITFSSAGGVQLFFDTVGNIPADTKCICIGAPTAQELRRRGIEPSAIAPEISAAGIVNAILDLSEIPSEHHEELYPSR